MRMTYLHYSGNNTLVAACSAISRSGSDGGGGRHPPPRSQGEAPLEGGNTAPWHGSQGRIQNFPRWGGRGERKPSGLLASTTGHQDQAADRPRRDPNRNAELPKKERRASWTGATIGLGGAPSGQDRRTDWRGEGEGRWAARGRRAAWLVALQPRASCCPDRGAERSGRGSSQPGGALNGPGRGTDHSRGSLRNPNRSSEILRKGSKRPGHGW